MKKALFIDEFDSGLSFVLTRAIVSLFNNIDNPGAQLVFASHDITLLDTKRLFLLPQIKLIAKKGRGAAIFSLEKLVKEGEDPRDLFLRVRALLVEFRPSVGQLGFPVGQLHPGVRQLRLPVGHFLLRLRLAEERFDRFIERGNIAVRRQRRRGVSQSGDQQRDNRGRSGDIGRSEEFLAWRGSQIETEAACCADWF